MPCAWAPARGNATSSATTRWPHSVPLLRQALACVGHVQTRNRGTVGGSLVHADPSAELPLVAQMLEAPHDAAHANRARGRCRRRTFFDGAMTTSVAPDECLTEIAVAGVARAQDRLGVHRDQPPPRRLRHRRGRRAGRGRRRRHLHARDLRRRRRGADAARLSRARAAPRRHPPGQGDAARASRTTPRRRSNPAATPHASADYRRHLAGVLVDARAAIAPTTPQGRSR